MVWEVYGGTGLNSKVLHLVWWSVVYDLEGMAWYYGVGGLCRGGVWFWIVQKRLSV